MVPTILGAWIGIETGAAAIFSGIMGFVLMLAGMFGFIYAIERTKNSALGVPVLLGFTFFMGLILSRLIGHVLGFRNGAELVMTAFGGTAGVFFVMASLATVIKRDLSGMGKWLFVGVIILLVASVIKTAAKPTTSAPPWPCTWTSSTCFKRCSACWVFSAANANKAVCANKKRPFGAFFTSPCRVACLSVSFEHRHAFHMGGMRKHIHHPCGHAAVPGLLDQHPGVTGQGCRVATHINQALRRYPVAAQVR